MAIFLIVIGLGIGLAIVIMMNPVTLSSVAIANSTANISQYSYLQEVTNFLPFTFIGTFLLLFIVAAVIRNRVQ